jgi:hypothetical protein
MPCSGAVLAFEELANEERAEREGREFARDDGVVMDEGVRGRRPGDRDELRPALPLGVCRKDWAGPPLFWVGVSGSASFGPMLRPSAEGGRRRMTRSL